MLGDGLINVTVQCVCVSPQHINSNISPEVHNNLARLCCSFFFSPSVGGV